MKNTWHLKSVEIAFDFSTVDIYDLEENKKGGREMRRYAAKITDTDVGDEADSCSC